MAGFEENRTLQLVEPLPPGCSTPMRRVSFTLCREDAGGLPVIALHGELDLATAPQLAAVVDSFDPGERIIVDLRGLTFMDCSGVRELMRASAVLEDGLQVVCGGDGPVRRLFDLAAVEQMLRVYSSRAQALHAPSGDGNAATRLSAGA